MNVNDSKPVDELGEVNANVEQFLTFLLNDQEYAVDILQVQGIQGWAGCTELPNTPEYIRGVINLRGAIVPIFDLRMRFEMASAEYNDLTVVVVVKIQTEDAEKTIGLVVDAVSEVYNIEKSEMSPPPEFGSDVESRYIKALANFQENLVILLDVEKLVNESLLGEEVFGEKVA